MRVNILWFLLSAVYVAQAQRPVPTLTLTPLRGNVHVLEGGLGNMTMLIHNNDILVVDTKAEEAGVPIEDLMTKQLPGKKIKYIVNTHMHWDHTGNNKRLGKDAVIIAQQHARKPHADSGGVRDGNPDLTFDSEMSIYFGGEVIRLIHFPRSHTDHDLVAFFTKSKVISMGDMYFTGMYPYITDDGDLKGLIANLNTIIGMMPPDVKVVPGHGPVSTLEDLKATCRMLVETSEYMRKQIDSGKSLEQISKEGLPAWTPAWGKGFCKEACWIETVYGFLKKQDR
jgi:cyclase